LSREASKWGLDIAAREAFSGNKESNRLAGIQKLEDVLKEMKKEAAGYGNI